MRVIYARVLHLDNGKAMQMEVANENRKNVSIIIPVFNAEKTLKRCLNSVLKINRNDIEIIIVDDGSNDKGLSICKAYEKKDKRIKTYTKENGGVSTARNYGMQKALGKWISFVDSDDEIIPQVYIRAIELLENDMELLVWKSMPIWEEFEKDRIKQEKIVVGTLKKKEIEIIQDGLIEQDKIEFRPYRKSSLEFAGPYAKFFRKDIIEKKRLKFRTDLKIGEDRIFNYQYFGFVEKMTFFNQCGYIYYQNSCSAMHVYCQNRYLEYYKLYLIFREVAPSRGYELAQLGIRMYLYMLKIDFCHWNNESSYQERKEQALKVRGEIDIERCFDEGSIYKLRKEAVLLAYFAKYRFFWACNFLLKMKEILKIKVKK